MTTLWMTIPASSKLEAVSETFDQFADYCERCFVITCADYDTIETVTCKSYYIYDQVCYFQSVLRYSAGLTL